MKAVCIGALLLLAVMISTAEGSGLRRLSGSSPAGRVAADVAGAQGARIMKAGGPLDASADMKAVPSGRVQGADRINYTCYRIYKNEYCGYAEQQQCCKGESRNYYNGCADWSNHENCPSSRPIMTCCY